MRFAHATAAHTVDAPTLHNTAQHCTALHCTTLHNSSQHCAHAWLPHCTAARADASACEQFLRQHQYKAVKSWGAGLVRTYLHTNRCLRTFLQRVDATHPLRRAAGATLAELDLDGCRELCRSSPHGAALFHHIKAAIRNHSAFSVARPLCVVQAPSTWSSVAPVLFTTGAVHAGTAVARWAQYVERLPRLGMGPGQSGKDPDLLPVAQRYNVRSITIGDGSLPCLLWPSGRGGPESLEHDAAMRHWRRCCQAIGSTTPLVDAWAKLSALEVRVCTQLCVYTSSAKGAARLTARVAVA